MKALLHTVPVAAVLLFTADPSIAADANAADQEGQDEVTVDSTPLLAAAAAPASNNVFTNATVLTGPIVSTTGSNVGANKEFGEPNHGGNRGGASVWWTWTAAASGSTTIDTQGSSFDTLLGVYTGNAVNQLAPIASNNNFENNSWSRVQFNAIAGTTYRIAVDGVRTGQGPGAQVATGTIALHVQGVGGLTVTTPTNGMVFTVGDPIPVEVTIDSDFPNPPATRVDFYRDGVLFGSSTTPPFSAMSTNAPAGTNGFYVIATDSTGAPIQSGVSKVFVQRIGVTLLSPADDTLFQNSNPIQVTAHAYLPSGVITNIEFFVDGTKFGEASSAPFGASWTNPVGGSHRLTAVGTSDSGRVYDAQPVNIGVASTLVATGAVWKYLDTGADAGTAWIAPDFDDSAWASGPGELGYGDGDESTVINSGPTNNFFITAYFRHKFVAGEVAGLSNVVVSLERDDAGVVYLNGREIFRSANLPAAPAVITFTNLATGQAVEDAVDTFTLNPTNLVSGTNVLAVEIHQQAANSSDLSFKLSMLGVPIIIHNLAPSVEITNLAGGQYFLAPSSIAIEASASDADGTVAKVEFFADGVKIGEDTTSPYLAVWDNPPIGPHALTAKATDDVDGTSVSAAIDIVVYDAAGTPFTRITRPLDGTAIEGGTNLLLTAYASAPNGVASVKFFSNGSLIGTDDTAPYSLVWDAPFGNNVLTTIVTDTAGTTGTSAPVTLRAFPNSTPPSVVAQTPAAGETISTLTSVSVTFSEPVHNVDATDLLINGVPARAVTGSGTRYTFNFTEPPYGTVNLTWASGHGITDFGFPADLPFNEAGAGAQWAYTLVDRTPPVVAARVPAAGAAVTSLQELTVTFSEAVNGVDASDLLVSGTPAFSVSGSGSTYTFLVSQPASGTINVTWATNSGIFDLSDVPNAFASSNGGWNFTLDSRTVLVQSNSVWHYFKGEGEPTTPVSAWRFPGFEVEDEWFEGPAPFFFGDPYTNALVTGTYLSDMVSNYSSIYLLTEFVVTNRSVITNLFLNHQSDDGFIAWINGVEVLRFNMPAGAIAYNGTASVQATEPGNAGAAYISAALPAGPTNLVNGTNILAVQAFNQSLTNADFGFNAQLYTFITDPAKVSPRLLTPSPAPGDLLGLTSITVTFTEPVNGVDASDLLIDGVPATGLSSTTNTSYTFTFPQPPFGPVAVTWAADHGITDFDRPPKPFIATATGSTFNYNLFNPINPRVASQSPAAATIITGLTSIAVTFTKPVTGVDAEDLIVGGTPAISVRSTDQTTFTFAVAQPGYGSVTVRWSTNHSIVDLESPANAFDPSRFGGQWNYTLVNPVPTVAITSPANNAAVLAPTITLRANATDGDGTISRVEFFEATAGKLGEATNAPYTYVWDNVVQGPYTLRAIATDNSGLTGTSAPVVINVVTSLPIVLVRGPYLQMGSSTSGIVRWRSDLFSDAVLYYGTEPGQLTNLVVRRSLTNEHIMAINGLEPETRYYYSIGNSSQRLAEGTNYWFDTSPVVGTKKPTRIWFLGDAGTAGNGSPDRQASTRDAFYRFAETNRPTDLWVMLGDNAYNSGTDSEYQAAVFDMYPTTLRNKFLWPALGNHETSQSTTATDFPYLHMFSLPTAGEVGGVPSGTEKYYSFDYANIHFVCLDSMTSGRTGTTPMANWLRTDLEATKQEWIIVYFHHSIYTKGTHDSDSEQDLVELRQNILPILEEHSVDLVLNGHSHVYERSYLLDQHYGLSGTLNASNKVDGGDGRLDGTGAYTKNVQGRGVVYTIAGSSGQALGGPLNLPAHYLSLNELGSVVIDVNGGQLDAQFLNASGVTRDHYTVLKPTPPPAPPTLLAHATGSTEIALTWPDPTTKEQGFVIERSLNGVDFLRIATNAVDVTTALDAGLLADTTYYYRVLTYNERGESGPSTVASATTILATSAPAAPSGLVVSANNAGQAYRSQLFLGWQDRSANESGFLIERSVNGGPFTPLTTVGANVTAYIDRSLASASSCFYRVSSFNPVASSAPSNLDGDQTHPRNELVVAGESAVFHAGVEGTAPIRYQWRFLGNAIPGATNEMLVVANAQAVNEGYYTVRITDASGSQESNPAWLIVLQPPSVVEQPVAHTNGIGGSVTFHVAATGTDPLRYQWRKDGQVLEGAHNSALALGPFTLAGTADYDVVVSNPYGSTTSRVARLTVTDNHFPALTAIPDFSVDVLSWLKVTNSASDSDPANRLTFTLNAGAPTNAILDPRTGTMRWKPTRAQAPSTNVFTITVHDNGEPDLTDSKSFTVVVNHYIEVTVGSTIAMAGSTTSSVPIEVFSSAGLRELQVILATPAEHVSNLSLEPVQPDLVTPSLALGEGGATLLSFATVAEQVMQGTQQVARLHFTAGSSSVFAPLNARASSSVMDDPSLVPAVLGNDGRVVVIGDQALLEGTVNSRGQRQLAIYGRVGSNYTLQSRFGSGPGTTWATRNTFPLTNVVQTITPPNATSPLIFFRLRQ